MQFFPEASSASQRPMLHATMNLFNCLLLHVIQKLCKLGNICKQDVQETAWESSLFFAENGPSDQFRKRVLFRWVVPGRTNGPMRDHESF